MTSTLIRQIISAIPANLDFKVLDDGILITGVIVEKTGDSIPLKKEDDTYLKKEVISKPKYNIPKALVTIQNALTNKLTVDELDELMSTYNKTNCVSGCYSTRASKKIFRIAGKQADSIIEQFIKLNI